MEDPRPCKGKNINICVAEGCHLIEYMGRSPCVLVSSGHIVCRCGRRQFDSWTCDHPTKRPLLCRMGMHRWSITTWPVNFKNCFRCGQKADGGGMFLVDKNRNEVVR